MDPTCIFEGTDLPERRLPEVDGSSTTMSTLLQVAYAGVLAGIVVGLLIALRSADGPAVANAVGAIVVALLPALVEVAFGVAGLAVAFTPALSLVLAVAGLLHVVGMLGWYDTVSWWDHLTHTVSAAIVAAVVHASLHTIDAGIPGVELSAGYVAAFTLLFVLAAGVCWELVELYAREVGERVGAPPVLEHYGLRDTALDLVFNAIGAVLVIGADVRTLGTVTEHSAPIANLVLTASVGVVFAGSVVLGVVLERS